MRRKKKTNKSWTVRMHKNLHGKLQRIIANKKNNSRKKRERNQVPKKLCFDKILKNKI